MEPKQLVCNNSAPEAKSTLARLSAGLNLYRGFTIGNDYSFSRPRLTSTCSKGYTNTTGGSIHDTKQNPTWENIAKEAANYRVIPGIYRKSHTVPEQENAATIHANNTPTTTTTSTKTTET